MNPINVNPKDWSDINIILNDLSYGYSVIFGRFRKIYCIGMRWNGGIKERGYPGQGPYPLWFVLPEPFENIILNELLKLSKINSSIDINVLLKAKETLSN